PGLEALLAKYARFLVRRVPQARLPRSAHGPRNDAGHPDAVAPELARHRARHALDPGLRGLVDREPGESEVPRHRAEIDDGAATRGLHAGRHGLRAEEKMPQVHGEAVLPVLGRDFLEAVPVVVGGVVDQNLDRPAVVFAQTAERLANTVQIA